MKHTPMVAALIAVAWPVDSYALSGDECIYDIPRCIKAGDAGDIGAQTSLAYLYSDLSSGKTVPKDAQKEAYWLTKAAGQGDTVSKRMLADMYEKGDGVKRDFTNAIRLFTEAANQGDKQAAQELTAAEAYLGSLYLTGAEGFEKDAKKAFDWTEKASQGSPDGSVLVALTTLGHMYCTGHGVEKNIHKCVDAYTKAATHGYDAAQLTLGLMYSTGHYKPDVPQDKELGYMWLSLAANNHGTFTSKATTALKDVESTMTTEELAKAMKRFAEWSKDIQKNGG
jgi:TPR repeat protein